MNYYLAIDIGASSGRHILGWQEDGQLKLEEIYRFDNRQLRKNGHDCWDMDNLWQEIIEGLTCCKALGKIPAAMGIDTWAVDFVLLDVDDQVIGDAVAYRDSRTEGMKEKVNQVIPAEELYGRTGIQYQPFNTIYQLMALKEEHPEQLAEARTFLMIPEYFHFRLTGVKQNEYTNATSTNLVNAGTADWDRAVMEQLGLPAEIFHRLAMPGTKLESVSAEKERGVEMPGTCPGNLLPEIQELVGFNTTVMLPATHDTGSAFLAVPARDENAVYISSGTWSLLGVENDHAITTPESFSQNFTNEGGAWYRYRYLKNIMGLWMIQSIRRELNGVDYVQKENKSEQKDIGRDSTKPVDCEKKFGQRDLPKQNLENWQRKTSAQPHQWSFPELIEEARKAENFPSVVDVNREVFLAPDSMIETIREECRRTGQPVPETVGELMQCVYTSLALCYRDAIKGLEALTGKTYTSINIVGGGCQDSYLNERTARATGLPVYAGPVEGTAIGNLMVQMIAHNEFTDLQAARDGVKRSFPIKEYKESREKWA